MSKQDFSEKELLVLQIALLLTNPDKILARFPIACDDLKNLLKSVLNKVADMLINPPEDGIHPLAVNREIFEKYHDKIKFALEIIDGDKYQEDKESAAIWELLGIIGVLCGKQLVANQAQIIGPSLI